MLDPRLEERVVLVTGTNNPYGIGAAIAQGFSTQGARVFLHYLRGTPKSGADARAEADDSPGESFYYSQQTKSIEEVLQRVRKSGAQVAALQGDLADPALIMTLFDRAEATLGPVAAELGRFGVTVNAVSLGPVQTGWITAELEYAILPTIPLARIGTPEDVADVVLFLASHQASWLTGQRIYIGGGRGM